VPVQGVFWIKTTKEVLFFEKRNQKTFTRWLMRPMSGEATDTKEQRFFSSFFQKKAFLSLPRTVAQPP
jgi:hypothetical protein